MTFPTLLLITATLFVGVTTGLVFAFAVVVMPGLRALSDRDFLRAFKAMDRIIQDNDPRFLIVWAGSVVLLIAAAVVHVPALSGVPRALLLGAVALYLLGVQLPTGLVNVPLNNQLQAQNLDALGSTELAAVRTHFEARWVFWNAFRTICGLVATGLLLAALYAI
ncbi:MAG: anthrone oxygenase family protein [Bacteroidota bacterium]